MGRLADVTLGDLGRALGRYRPAIVAVAVMVVVLQLLPDRTPRVAPLARGERAASTAGGPQVARDDADGSDDAAAGDAEDDFDGSAFTEDEAAFEGSFDDGDSGGFDDDAGFEDDEDFDDDSSFEEMDDDEGFDGGGGDGGSLEDDVFMPLFVMEYGWATATAGTPVASSEVPDGSMPVGKRIGQNDKISFFRLIGTATSLELHEASEGQRTPPIGEIGVQLCQSKEDGWSGGEAQTFDAAPSWDAGQCVDGVRSDDGTWSFDMSGFESVDDRRGFVLVPAADAAVDFQVAFAPR